MTYMQKLMSMNNIVSPEMQGAAGAKQGKEVSLIDEIVTGMQQSDQVKALENEMARQGDLINKLQREVANAANPN